MRFALTQMELEKSLKHFKIDLTLHLASSSGTNDTLTPNEATALLKDIQNFCMDIECICITETKEWIGEFKSSLTLLEKQLRVAAEQRSKGSLIVTVENADTWNEITISANGSIKRLPKNNRAIVINEISPGVIEIRAEGTRKDENGKQVTGNAFSQSTIKSGSQSMVSLTLTDDTEA